MIDRIKSFIAGQGLPANYVEQKPFAEQPQEADKQYDPHEDCENHLRVKRRSTNSNKRKLIP